MLTPVALFVYNRPEHTLKTLDALAGNILAGETILFIFSDGPKNNPSPDDLNKIRRVRTIINNENRFIKTIIIESLVNRGLAASIIAGVTTVFEKHDTIIVLEDDILTAKHFLKFCNNALEKYQFENRVMAISGFSFQASKNLPDTFFLSIVACWGWATWKDRWKLFNNDATALLNEIKRRDKITEFNFNNSYNYYGLLQSQAEGRINSWAVRWYASIFLNNGLALYPSRSLTQNIGMDGTGTHYTGIVSHKKGGREVVLKDENYGNPLSLTNAIFTDENIEIKFQTYLRNIYKYGIFDRIKMRLKAIFS